MRGFVIRLFDGLSVAALLVTPKPHDLPGKSEGGCADADTDDEVAGGQEHDDTDGHGDERQHQLRFGFTGSGLHCASYLLFMRCLRGVGS
jgi:hypothetical protein